MSAWMCSQNHISYLIAGGLRLDVDYPPMGDGTTLTLNDIQSDMTAENVLSLHARYEERAAWLYKDNPANPVFIRPDREMDEVTLYKQACCYEYQACEHNDYEDSRAAAFIGLITQELNRRGISGDSPGYDNAPWGID